MQKPALGETVIIFRAATWGDSTQSHWLAVAPLLLVGGFWVTGWTQKVLAEVCEQEQLPCPELALHTYTSQILTG